MGHGVASDAPGHDFPALKKLLFLPIVRYEHQKSLSKNVTG
jgi:hypothetical protein